MSLIERASARDYTAIISRIRCRISKRKCLGILWIPAGSLSFSVQSGKITVCFLWPKKGNKNLSFVSCRFVLVFPFFHIRQCRSSDFLWPKKGPKNLFWKRMTAHEKLIIRTIQSYYFTLSQIVYCVCVPKNDQNII